MPDRDENERLRRENAGLRAELERQRETFARGPVVVFRWRAVDGWPVESVYGNVADLFGHSAEDFLSASVSYASVVHPDDLPRVGAEVARHSEDGSTRFQQDYRIVHQDGSVRWLHDETTVLRDQDGTITHYAGYVFDVTDRIRAEAEVRRREAELRAAQKTEALGRLAGGIAHDFSNLLTALVGHTDLAATMLAPDAPARGPLDRVRSLVGKASDLTSGLLAFARRQVLEPRTADLGAVVRESLDLVAPMLVGHRVELVIGDGPSWVRVDPGQLGQVLVNLVLNARDAMPIGGRLQVTLSSETLVGPRSAALDDRIPPGAYVVLAVEDEGTGMDVGTLSRVFEPLFSTKGAEGTGLGLAVVYGIVRQSDGWVTVQSTPGRGSRFEVWLPRLEDRTATPAMAVTPSPARRAEGHRVLLVEDHQEIREVTAQALTARGWTVVAVADGEAALRELDRGPAPDLLVTDLSMPGISGTELIERLDAMGSPLPVLVVSGWSEPGPAHRGGRRRAQLHKPYTAETLSRAMRALLDERRG